MKLFDLKRPAALWMRPVQLDYVPGTYVKEFDGWRGMSIFFVALSHYVPAYFMGGWTFMEEFFVLSGFLITGILLDTKTKKGYYRGFILRRILRVFPLYYLALILLFFVVPSAWIASSYERQHQVWWWTYTENWLFSAEGWPPGKSMRHFWSLAIEEQFYVLWPLVVYFFSTKNLIRFCVFLFFFSWGFRNIGMYIGFVNPFPYVATFGRMEPLVLGALVATLARTNRGILERMAIPVTVTAGALSVAGFCVAGTMHMEYYINYGITYTLLDLFFAGALILTMCGNELVWVKKYLLNTKMFKTLGVMSYCIYIFHHPINELVRGLWLDYFRGITGGQENLAKLICVIIAIIITVPVVYFLHKKVEIPLWKLKRYV